MAGEVGESPSQQSRLSAAGDEAQRTTRRSHRGCAGGIRVTTWNTQGTKAKKEALLESLASSNSDVILLQETMESEEFFLDGYRTIHRPAETGAGKQGVALAVRAQLQSRELGAVSP
ncbi:MAG: uncharacterized protein A8A55_2912, partial [Amphiamblys sp. WSBS2006]